MACGRWPTSARAGCRSARTCGSSSVSTGTTGSSRRPRAMTMSENVYVVSAAMIPFGKHRSSSYVGLAVSPLIDALRRAGIGKSDVDAVYVGHSYGGMMTGQRITKEIGLGTIPTVNVDNACSSGASAIHEAWESIAQGLIDVAV